MNSIKDLLKTKESRISTIFAGIGLLLGCILLIMTLSKAVNNINVKQEITQLSEKVNYIKELTEDEEKLKNEIEKISEKSKMISIKIPETANIPQSIEQLISNIEDFNLKLISVIHKEPVEIRKQIEQKIEGRYIPDKEIGEIRPDYVKIPIEICLRGSYKDIGRYLDALRYLSRLVATDEISFKKTEQAGVLDIKLLVSVWYSEL